MKQQGVKLFLKLELVPKIVCGWEQVWNREVNLVPKPFFWWEQVWISIVCSYFRVQFVGEGKGGAGWCEGISETSLSVGASVEHHGVLLVPKAVRR